MVRNSFGWIVIINNLKKNGGKFGACSVEVLGEKRGPVNGAERVINGIKVSFVIRARPFCETDDTVEKGIWVKRRGRKG